MLRVLVIWLCFAVALSTAMAQPTVTAVRVGEHRETTRFVMEISEAPRYRVFTLADPSRVVIDLPELRWRPSSDLPGKGDGLVGAMRFGLFAPGTSRVVLDMHAPVRIKKVFIIAPQEGYPHRLVVDITAAGGATSGRDQPILSPVPLAPLRAAVVAPAKPKADTRPTIVIDPGHGGIDPGSRSITGTNEKKIVLAFARALKRRLEATGRYRVHTTRNKDIFVRLRDRVDIAQRVEGSLFLSLHANNHESRKIRGAAVYTLSETASDADAGKLAAKENKADIIAGIDFSDKSEEVGMILIDLARRETMNLSKQFANMLVGELGRVTRLLKNSHRFAGFAVLKSPTVASVLLEIGYLSNKTEERLLRSGAHRTAIADATARAIDAYFAWQEALNRS